MFNYVNYDNDVTLVTTEYASYVSFLENFGTLRFKINLRGHSMCVVSYAYIHVCRFNLVLKFRSSNVLSVQSLLFRTVTRVKGSYRAYYILSVKSMRRITIEGLRATMC